jgi:putative endonuclease
LVYVEVYTLVLDALAREKQLKKWNRQKKIALIEIDNKEWNELVIE